MERCIQHEIVAEDGLGQSLSEQVGEVPLSVLVHWLHSVECFSCSHGGFKEVLGILVQEREMTSSFVGKENSET